MRSVDIFCRVIDNYGDIGVCWRVARQLADEYSLRVRLIVDDLSAFRFIAPDVDAAMEMQTRMGVQIVQWDTSSTLRPADIVIEAFACDPPDAYVVAMAALARKPTWINLEYLSAEAWVDGVHGLPSPHPRLPLTKYFFCPGFSEQSGGLIRENSLAAAFDARSADLTNPVVVSPQRVEGSNHEHPSQARPNLFAFAYPHAPVRAFATAVNAYVSAAAPFNASDPSWASLQPVAQPDFDALLAQFDVLIVRGEDSFVRAQYAAKPMLWHIYPTADDAHLVKLDAWLDHYCAGLDAVVARAIRTAHHAFNVGDARPESYAAFALHLPSIERHALRWREQLCAQPDLAACLLAFISLKEKQKVS